ncbi:cuticle protein CP14.6-like [Leguminivora glycinivorella]|uniref:cuticle protein CP14.6-like n=1 Tax=Leguminivora glycinivorella TaxID=1035111 RepID=UPI002010B829|nr:cuticle protein CP14.6-like [Leguminivora glycinivorella]
MRLWILCCLVAAVVVANPLDKNVEDVKLIFNENYNPGGNRGFRTTYEQTDGTLIQTQGELVKVDNDGTEVEVLVISGSYSFFIDGVKYTVRYTADQNGYHPMIITGAEKPPSGVPGPILASLLGG